MKSKFVSGFPGDARRCVIRQAPDYGDEPRCINLVGRMETLMSMAVDLDLLKTFGQIAAPAGLAIGAFLYLGRDIVAKNIFPALTKQHAYHIIIVLAFMAWTVALAGIASWTYVSTHTPEKSEAGVATKQLPPLPGDTGWVFAGYFNIAKENFIEGHTYQFRTQQQEA